MTFNTINLSFFLSFYLLPFYSPFLLLFWIPFFMNIYSHNLLALIFTLFSQNLSCNFLLQYLPLKRCYTFSIFIPFLTLQLFIVYFPLLLYSFIYWLLVISFLIIFYSFPHFFRALAFYWTHLNAIWTLECFFFFSDNCEVFYFVHYRSFSGHFSSSLTDLWHYFGDFSLPNSICSAKISYFCYKLWLVEQWIMLNRIIIVVIRISFSLNLKRSSSCKKKWRILSGFFPFASWQDI